MIDLSELALAGDVWRCWRFEPWENYGMKGVYRRVTFIKAGLMGEVARYYADDYVIWTYEKGAHLRARDFFRPMKDLMTQRLLFVSPQEGFSKKIHAFALGFKGYLELYRYSPMGQGYRKIKDLTPLVDKAWELSSIEKNKGGEI